MYKEGMLVMNMKMLSVLFCLLFVHELSAMKREEEKPELISLMKAAIDQGDSTEIQQLIKVNEYNGYKDEQGEYGEYLAHDQETLGGCLTHAIRIYNQKKDIPELRAQYLKIIDILLQAGAIAHVEYQDGSKWTRSSLNEKTGLWTEHSGQTLTSSSLGHEYLYMKVDLEELLEKHFSSY